ncbi:MAG TPA: peptide deformylase [Blastocatellia bacterium]|nr:peptide deformylase [Blastocatellia bacterium]
MPVREILLLGNERLWRPSAAVADVQSRETQETIRDLAETLGDFRARKGFGRAIAAPQIGVHRRIVFVNMGEPLPLVNPVITHRSAEMMELWDDCFSFPDLMVRLRRHLEIGVSFEDEHGRAQRLTAQGDLSELLQHEIDHLDGVLAVDRAIDARSFALRQEVEKLRRQA